MINKPTFFSLDEMVCEHVYNAYGEMAWTFFDSKLLITLDTIRDRINAPIYVNNWQVHGGYSQRGLRCLRCDLVKDKCRVGAMYQSAHLLGKGVDFEVQGLVAEEVRLWIAKNARWWPYPIRLETGVSWVHLDVFDNKTEQKVYLFKAA